MKKLKFMCNYTDTTKKEYKEIEKLREALNANGLLADYSDETENQVFQDSGDEIKTNEEEPCNPKHVYEQNWFQTFLNQFTQAAPVQLSQRTLTNTVPVNNPTMVVQQQGGQGSLPAAYASNMSQQKRNRKSKKREILCLFPDGIWHLLSVFDDGSSVDQGQIFLNVFGHETIFIARFSKFSGIDTHFLLIFSNISIWGKFDGTLRKNIITAFVQCGANLSSTISAKQVEDAICNYFEPRIAQCRDQLTFQERPDWIFSPEKATFKPYLDPAMCKQDFFELPINQKSFPQVFPDWGGGYDLYLNAIGGELERTLLMLIPVAGLLSPWSSRYGLPLPIVNAIYGIKENVGWVSRTVSVFNRDCNNIVPANLKQNEIEKFIYRSHADVLIIDVRRDSESENRSKIDKKLETVAKIVNYFGSRATNEYPSLDVRTDSALLILNSVPIQNPGIVNIFLSPMLELDNSLQRYDYVGAFIADFAQWCEKNTGAVDAVFQTTDPRVAELFGAISKIVRMFRADRGMSIEKMLSPEVLVSMLSDSRVPESGQLLENFRCSFRSVARQFACSNNIRDLPLTGVFCDDEYLYFSSEVFNGLMEMTGFSPLKRVLLSTLKSADLLDHDPEGYTKRQMIEGNRFELYKIKISAFDRIGSIDVRAIIGGNYVS